MNHRTGTPSNSDNRSEQDWKLKAFHEVAILRATENDWLAAAWWLASRFPEEYGGCSSIPVGGQRGEWVAGARWLEEHFPDEYAPALDNFRWVSDYGTEHEPCQPATWIV